MESSTVILGALLLLAGAMVPPIAGDLWRKVKGTEYATRKECAEKHEAMEKDCTACKAATKATICAIQHDAAKNRKLLLLIAIKLQVPQDELKDYL